MGIDEGFDDFESLAIIFDSDKPEKLDIHNFIKYEQAEDDGHAINIHADPKLIAKKISEYLINKNQLIDVTEAFSNLKKALSKTPEIFRKDMLEQIINSLQNDLD